MRKDVFDFKDYKLYLKGYIQVQPKRGRGIRLAMAEFISSPVSHISQVLNGNSQLSMEQAEGLNEFLGHTDDEAQYFLLLVQLGKAGTQKLKSRYNNQIQKILEKRLVLKDRLNVKQTLEKEDQAEFYSSWLYGAIHVIVTIPRFQTKESISQYLGISLKRTSEILDFLISTGLVDRLDNGKYKIGVSQIHLGADSPLISKFHTNWRMKAIQSLEKENATNDLHYSSVVTISDSDFMRIKSILVKNIEEVSQVVRESPEEGVHSLCIDFFRI